MFNELKMQFKKKNSFLPYITILFLASFITIIVEFSFDDAKQKDKTVSNEKQLLPAGIDTLIPAGYVLVPVEISNHDSLHSILGQHGIVDLFLPAKSHSERPIRIARQIRLLRAPKNPHRFAVLARDQDSSRFVRLDHPLFAVIQNPKHKTIIKQVEERAKKRRIYFSDSDS